MFTVSGYCAVGAWSIKKSVEAFLNGRRTTKAEEAQGKAEQTWLTVRIAKVIRDPEVRERKGQLRRADLTRIWGELEGPVREHMVRLMNEFDLAYPAGSGDESMVVQAMPSAPAEERELKAETEPIEMVFKYPDLQRHLPPGVPAWTFAKAYRSLKPGKGPWSDVAVFEDAEFGSQATIVASDLAREVRLKVAGGYPPYFFGYLMKVLEETFRRYPGVMPEYRVPCKCKPGCKNSYLHSALLKGRGRITRGFVR